MLVESGELGIRLVGRQLVIDSLQDLLDLMLQLRLATRVVADHLDRIVGPHGRATDFQLR